MLLKCIYFALCPALQDMNWLQGGYYQGEPSSYDSSTCHVPNTVLSSLPSHMEVGVSPILQVNKPTWRYNSCSLPCS